MNERQTWRVVVGSGEVREVVVARQGHYWVAFVYGVDGTSSRGRECGWERAAVARLVGDSHWSVVEIRGPGELTTAERTAALQAIIDGRDSPPTDAEIAAHASVRGGWRYIGPGRFPMARDVVAACQVRELAEACRFDDGDAAPRGRWWAIDAKGVLCAPPVVAEVEAQPTHARQPGAHDWSIALGGDDRIGCRQCGGVLYTHLTVVRGAVVQALHVDLPQTAGIVRYGGEAVHPCRP